MKRFFPILVGCLLLSGCRAPVILAVNSCSGTYMRIKRDNGPMVAKNLVFGSDTSIKLDVFSRKQYFLVLAYSLVDSQPVGSAVRPVSLENGGEKRRVNFGPQRFEPWIIDSLRNGNGQVHQCTS